MQTTSVNPAADPKLALFGDGNTSLSPDPLTSNPMRFLADGASVPLFSRVPTGTLIAYVAAANWSSPGRRQYAIGAAATVETFRLMKRVFPDADYGDQVVPLSQVIPPPAKVVRAARKLQALAFAEIAESLMPGHKFNGARAAAAMREVYDRLRSGRMAAKSVDFTDLHLPNPAAFRAAGQV